VTESGHLRRNPVSQIPATNLTGIWPDRPDSGHLVGSRLAQAREAGSRPVGLTDLARSCQPAGIRPFVLDSSLYLEFWLY
jgi:hypothetical protein